MQEAKPLESESSHSDLKMTAQEWMAVLGGALGAFMAILDIQITNASLREIQGALGLDFSEGGWISTSYLIAEIAVIPLTGYLSQVFGLRNYLVTNCLLFIGASVLCGLSWDLGSMIFFRALQGLTGGVLIPLSFQIMLVVMPPAQKSIGLAIFGLTATLAPTLGPSLGGWLTDHYGWRSSFFINIAPGLLAVWALRQGLAAAPMDLSRLKRMDFLGTALLCTGLGTLTFLLEDGAKRNWFEDTTIQVSFLLVCATLPLFAVTQFVRKEPLLNLRLLLDRNFGVSAVITTITAMTLYGGIYALSLYLSQIQQYGALEIGQVMMWVGIPQLFVMPTLPWLMKRVDLRILAVAGMLLFMASNMMNSNLTTDYGGDQFRISLIVRAIGQPLFMIPLSAIGMSMIHPEEAGNASAIFNVMRNLGGSIGIAITGTLLVNRQYIHFARNSEHLNNYAGGTNELLRNLANLFLINGSEPSKVQDQALALTIGSVHRESLIQSFGDVFYLMGCGLAFCSLMILLLSRVKGVRTPGDPMH